MDPAKQEEQREKFMAVTKMKPEYQKKALELYGFKIKDGDRRPADLILREAYLEFYTKSLQPDHIGGPYNKASRLK